MDQLNSYSKIVKTNSLTPTTDTGVEAMFVDDTNFKYKKIINRRKLAVRDAVLMAIMAMNLVVSIAILITCIMIYRDFDYLVVQANELFIPAAKIISNLTEIDQFDQLN